MSEKTDAKVRILLVDDHTLLREGLVRLLEADPAVEVVGDCANIREARKILANAAIDVVLLDYDLGEETGEALLKHLNQASSTVRVLMLTAGMLPTATLQAIQSGVAGVVLKQSGTRHLLDAIHRVARGETWWTSETLRTAVGIPLGKKGVPEPARELTPRQRLVLRGILDGLTNKEIAAQLDASETSVKASIQELFTKAGVRTRGQLVRITLERFSSTWLPNP
jgi:two-component system nitrate/nitrite response regulator NarL